MRKYRIPLGWSKALREVAQAMTDILVQMAEETGKDKKSYLLGHFPVIPKTTEIHDCFPSIQNLGFFSIATMLVDWRVDGFYSNMTQICMVLWEFNWYPEHDFHSLILRRTNINWGLKMGPIRWSIQGEALRLRNWIFLTPSTVIMLLICGNHHTMNMYSSNDNIYIYI